MRDRFIRPTLLASITGALIIAAVPALAGPMENASADVRYGDLDLASDAGVTQLNRRIRSAARKLCGTPDIRDIKASEAASACRAAALAQVTPKIELAVANARSGRSLAANAAVEVGTPASR